jgi:hypothetical protein
MGFGFIRLSAVHVVPDAALHRVPARGSMRRD